MKNLSLDAEPPSKFDGKKEVKRKKNETLPHLVILLGNEKIRNKTNNSTKNLENEIKKNFQKYFFNSDYLKKEGGSIEGNLTSTKNIIEFTNTNTAFNQTILDSHYAEKVNNVGFKERKSSNFYEMNTFYSFTPKIREEDKKEDLSTLPKEQESKEISYTLYNFDEETEQEN
jgi:hypothetical protein